MRRAVVVALALALITSACAEPPRDAAPAPDIADVGSLEDLGLVARMGTREHEGRAAILHAPRDAELSAGEIVVLDASDPWLRVFDRSGRFLRAVGQDGVGPGEAMNPASLTGIGSGFTVWESGGSVELGGERDSRRNLGPFGYRVRGAVRCGGELMALTGTLLPSDEPGVLARIHPAGVLDTLLLLGPPRVQAHQYPFFGAEGEGSVILYGDEVSQDRILEVTCDGEILREIRLPPLGEGERWEQTEAGWALHPAAAPFPAGLARVQGTVIWAEQEQLEPGDASDPEWATVFTAFPDDAPPRRLRVPGRFQLLDSAPDGMLLLAAREPIPEVFLLDGKVLLSALTGNGGEREGRPPAP